MLQNDSYMPINVKTKPGFDDNHLEDVIYLLVTIMDQARDQYLLLAAKSNSTKNCLKINVQFNSCTSKLVESMRKDKDIINLKIEDDITLVKIILKWLYKAMDQNKKYLAPILRPYLNTLFVSTHSLSWHLEFIRQRMNTDEKAALSYFAKLINSAKITPAEGLIDAVNKNWSWAKNMLRMVEKNTLRVVFVPSRGKVYRHILSLPSYHRNKDDDFEDEKTTKKLHTLPPNRNYFSTILKESKCFLFFLRLMMQFFLE